MSQKIDIREQISEGCAPERCNKDTIVPHCTCLTIEAASMSVLASAPWSTAEHPKSFLRATVGRSTTPPSNTVTEYRYFRKNCCSRSVTYWNTTIHTKTCTHTRQKVKSGPLLTGWYIRQWMKYIRYIKSKAVSYILEYDNIIRVVCEAKGGPLHTEIYDSVSHVYGIRSTVCGLVEEINLSINVLSSCTWTSFSSVISHYIKNHFESKIASPLGLR